MTDREKLLDKLMKLKAHAESAAKIGSEAEAEAFAAMLQQLMMKHKIEMTDLELEEQEQDEPVEQHPLDWQDVRVRATRVAWIERLAAEVARAYFCRILVHRNSSRITLVGRKTDAMITEFMIVTLTRTAESIARREYGRIFRQDKYAARGFRDSFLKSFTMRIIERLKTERANAESNPFALVRFNGADRAVQDYLNSIGTKNASIIRGTRRGVNSIGWQRGQELANSVNLNAAAHAVGNGASLKQIQ